MIKDTVADRIRALRSKSGLSMSQFGEKLDVKKSTVQSWEEGRAVPSLEKAAAISQLCKVTTDYIIGLDDEEKVSLEQLTEDQKRLVREMLNYFERVEEHDPDDA
ncbi:MAG: helix-turn-helix transcriptional regulator [Eubacterium sp.]